MIKDQGVLNKDRFKPVKTDLSTETVNQINQLVDYRISRHTDIISKSLHSDYLPIDLQCVRLHISKSFIYKLRYQGKINLYKLGGLTYVKSSEIDTLFEKVSD